MGATRSPTPPLSPPLTNKDSAVCITEREPRAKSFCFSGHAFEEQRALKEAQATEAPNSAVGSGPRVREPEKNSSSPLKNTRATKKIRYSFATPHGTMYGVGTDPESARKDMESNQDRIAAEAGTRALQMLAADPNYNKMFPAIAEAFERQRQRQRQKGTFCPISFLLPEQVPGSLARDSQA
ncbi:hypothetical protein SLS57_006491 [Botryosphaeria dothidea]